MLSLHSYKAAARQSDSSCPRGWDTGSPACSAPCTLSCELLGALKFETLSRSQNQRISKYKRVGLPWQSSGEDSVPPMREV